MSNRLASRETFSSIYNHFRTPIFRYVLGRVSDVQVAEEVTQDIFVKVYRFQDNYDERYAFSTWLWTVAKNTLLDHLRGTKGEPSDFGPSDKGFMTPDEIPSYDYSAEALIIKKDERRKILKMMKTLTRLQKRVLWMRIIHQLSYEEISKNLGVSLSAVKNLAYRAKASLTSAEFSLSGAS